MKEVNFECAGFATFWIISCPLCKLIWKPRIIASVVPDTRSSYEYGIQLQFDDDRSWIIVKIKVRLPAGSLVCVSDGQEIIMMRHIY